jgi:8-oxo-dGTP pyrophosphatase MutT (NUDIX family)
MNFEEYCQTLREYLDAQTLPGLDVHMQLAPLGRIDTHYSSVPEDARRAAVLILLYQRDAEIYIPLIRRTQNDADHHAGQIALPGGAHEAEEAYPIQTALREAQEEIAMHPQQVKVLGMLSPLFIPVSNFAVTPVVACSYKKPELRPQPSEVEEILHIPLTNLLKDPEEGIFKSSRGELAAPFYRSEYGRIWGATAMLLSEFVYVHTTVDYQNKL